MQWGLALWLNPLWVDESHLMEYFFPLQTKNLKCSLDEKLLCEKSILGGSYPASLLMPCGPCCGGLVLVICKQPS